MRMFKSLFFHHIPKTAGTSLRFWLSEFFSASSRFPYHNYEDLKSVSPDEVARYSFFSGHFGLSLYSWLLEKPDTITWLRQPVFREISQYYYWRSYEQWSPAGNNPIQISPEQLEFFKLTTQLSIKELFLSDIYIGFSDNLQVRYLAGVAPQTSGKKLCNDEMLETAKKNLLSFLHFGLCELMNPSLDLLCYIARLPPHNFSLHINSNNSSKLLSSLSEEELEIVKTVNHYDCELYEFALGLFRKRYHEMLINLTENLDLSSQFIEDFISLDLSLLSAQEINQKYNDRQFRFAVASVLKENFQQAAKGCEQFEKIILNCNDAAFISGWYPRQFYKDRTWLRWAGPKTESSVLLPLKSGLDYKVTIDVCFCGSFQILKTLHLQVEDMDLELRLISEINDVNPDIRYKLVGIIPVGSIKKDIPFTELIFKVDEVVESPIKHGDKIVEVRYISFAMSCLVIEPLREHT
jgi:hypothetical protein